MKIQTLGLNFHGSGYHIFEPLFTTKPEGGGLGLFITKSMIEKHGGHLKVTSESGQGALFEISLRRALNAPASPLV